MSDVSRKNRFTDTIRLGDTGAGDAEGLDARDSDFGLSAQGDDTTRVSQQPLPHEEEDARTECLVVLYGGTIGRKYELDGEPLTIGRDASNRVILDVPSVSRHHVRIERSGRGRRLVEDLGSTNGTYVNDEMLEHGAEEIQSGDLVRVGDVIFKYLAGQNIEAAYHEEIYRMTISDGLTGIANLRAFEEFLEREFARSKRYQRELSVLMLDIDHFKEINDTYGHLTGDYVLRDLGELLHRRMRREELVARYGGEEFALVLPETDAEGARRYAETLRHMIEHHDFRFEGRTLTVTASFGVGTFELSMSEPRELVAAADRHLYRAKQVGRNRVES